MINDPPYQYWVAHCLPFPVARMQIRTMMQRKQLQLKEPKKERKLGGISLRALFQE